MHRTASQVYADCSPVAPFESWAPHRTYATVPDAVWDVYFDTGGVQVNGKDDAYRVRAVRGGGS